MDAGCRMADMISLNQLKAFKAHYPDIPVVCYVNSTAEVKSECDHVLYKFKCSKCCKKYE